jgi:hypothetical protein
MEKRACWGGDELGARLLGSHGRPLRVGWCAWEKKTGRRGYGGWKKGRGGNAKQPRARERDPYL